MSVTPAAVPINPQGSRFEFLFFVLFIASFGVFCNGPSSRKLRSVSHLFLSESSSWFLYLFNCFLSGLSFQPFLPSHWSSMASSLNRFPSPARPGQQRGVYRSRGGIGVSMVESGGQEGSEAASVVRPQDFLWEPVPVSGQRVLRL